MQKVQKPPPPLSTAPPEFSTEDWLIIDRVLNRVAKSLRKIEVEQRQMELVGTENQSSEIQRQRAG